MKTAYKTSAAAVITAMLFLLMPVTALAVPIFVQIDGGGDSIMLEVELSDSIDSIRAKIKEKKGIPEELQLLYFDGTLLENAKALADYGITVGETIDLVIIKSITGFTIPGQIGSTVIGANTVTLTMPHGTDLTSLTPTISVSTGATISPPSGMVQDFTSPVIYTVNTTWDTSTKEYTVTVNVASADAAEPGEANDDAKGGSKKYTVIKIPDTWIGSGDAAWEIDGPYNKFKRLRLDGGTVGGENYTVAEGSTVITLRESYIKTLPNGIHTFRAEFENGYAELAFTVNVNPAALDDVPKTGDDSDYAGGGSITAYIIFALILTAAIAAGIVIIIKHRRTLSVQKKLPGCRSNTDV